MWLSRFVIFRLRTSRKNLLLPGGVGISVLFFERMLILVYFSKLELDTNPLPKDLKKDIVYFSIEALGTPYFNKKFENRWSLLLQSTFWVNVERSKKNFKVSQNRRKYKFSKNWGKNPKVSQNSLKKYTVYFLNLTLCTQMGINAKKVHCVLFLKQQKTTPNPWCTF